METANHETIGIENPRGDYILASTTKRWHYKVQLREVNYKWPLIIIWII